MSCSTSDMRRMDIGLPTANHAAMHREPLFRDGPASVADVEMQCRRQGRQYLAASFRGTLAPPDAHKQKVHARAGLRAIAGKVVPHLGEIQIVFSDRKSRRNHQNFSSYEMDMLHSHFGLAPRGDNLYTRRFLEIMSSGVIPIVLADGWVPPFDEIIDWPSASVFIPERRARDIPKILSRYSLDQVCAMRRNAFELYHKYLKSPARWEVAFVKIMQKRALHESKYERGLRKEAITGGESGDRNERGAAAERPARRVRHAFGDDDLPAARRLRLQNDIGRRRGGARQWH